MTPSSRRNAHDVRVTVVCLLAVHCYCLFTLTGQLHAEDRQPSTEHGSPETALEKSLYEQVKGMMKRLHAENVKIVGVLKFAVRNRNEDRWPGSVGTFNMRLAEKTEMALAWANPVEDTAGTRQIGLVRNATAVAATIPRAAHLSPSHAERQRLFTARYPLAWKVNGASTALVDAFFFGVAEIHSDLRNIDVELSILIKGSPDVVKCGPFTAPLDATDLSAIGENYSVPLATNTPPGQFHDQAIDSAAHIQTAPATYHPLALPDSPVQLKIYYNDQLQPLQFVAASASQRKPGAYVPEPRHGDSIHYVIERKRAEDRTPLGLLFKVNGQNTVGKESLPDELSRLWVLPPDTRSVVIRGYQIADGVDGKRLPFQVFEGSREAELATFYGQHAGLISLSVYQEKPKDAPPIYQKRSNVETLTMQHGILPNETAENCSQLRGTLTDSIFAQMTRGIVAPSANQERAGTRYYDFKRHPQAILTATIRYRHAQ